MLVVLVMILRAVRDAAVVPIGPIPDYAHETLMSDIHKENAGPEKPLFMVYFPDWSECREQWMAAVLRWSQ
jgi:hypothetical protein